MKFPHVSRTTCQTRSAMALVVSALLVSAPQAWAAGEVKAVATFSILGDLVRQVGGDRVEVTVLVGAGGDTHVFQPSPSQAKSVAQAGVLFSNGLGYEPWMDRLVRASGFKGRRVVVSQGVKPLKSSPPEAKGGHDRHDHAEVDPHAWQHVSNVKIYIKNIAAALCDVDLRGCNTYRQNERFYAVELDRLDAEIRNAWSRVPLTERKVITSHDAFGYYAQAYQVRFLAAQGINTSAEALPQNVAKLVRQIKTEKIKALFIENISNPRLMEQIGRETGLQPAGALFSDSLSGANGDAPDYLALMRHNTRVLLQAIEGQEKEKAPVRPPAE